MLQIMQRMPAPHWALLERQLLDALPPAIEAFYEHYFDERGYLDCFARWGALDGPDDAIENVTGWTEIYALGGPERLLELYKRGMEGHIRQYAEARTEGFAPSREGMYYKEYPTAFDPVHNAEGYHGIYQQGLCEPDDPRWQGRIRRFAGFYMNEDPGAPNYDAELKMIRSMMTGSRGPVLYNTSPTDWGGDPFEVEGRFTPLRWHRTWDDYVEHFSSYVQAPGDNPCNLANTLMALQAYMFSGEQKYYDWITEYLDAWIARGDANGGLMPTHIAIDGSLGGPEGRWWGSVYGWDHKAFFHDIAPYGFGNGLLLTGDAKYVDVWRRHLDAVVAEGREEEGEMRYPRKRGDDGFYEYRADLADFGALQVYYWSLRESDRQRASAHPWVQYLSGDNPDYPVARLQGDLEALRSCVTRRVEDTTTADTRLSEWPNNMNPGGTIWGLILLMLGALPSHHIGVPWHARVRYFDVEKQRPGIPEGVASLVDSMSEEDASGSHEVGVTLVNIDTLRPKTLVLQGGAYGEHQIQSAAVDEAEPATVDANRVTVSMAPGSGARLRLRMRRYANRPSLSLPWQ